MMQSLNNTGLWCSTFIVMYPFLDGIFTPVRHIYHHSLPLLPFPPQSLSPSLLLIFTAHKLKYHLSGIVCVSVWISLFVSHRMDIESFSLTWAKIPGIKLRNPTFQHVDTVLLLMSLFVQKMVDILYFIRPGPVKVLVGLISVETLSGEWAVTSFRLKNRCRGPLRNFINTRQLTGAPVLLSWSSGILPFHKYWN